MIFILINTYFCLQLSVKSCALSGDSKFWVWDRESTAQIRRDDRYAGYVVPRYLWKAKVDKKSIY